MSDSRDRYDTVGWPCRRPDPVKAQLLNRLADEADRGMLCTVDRKSSKKCIQLRSPSNRSFEPSPGRRGFWASNLVDVCQLRSDRLEKLRNKTLSFRPHPFCFKHHARPTNSSMRSIPASKISRANITNFAN
jgi:hypothetical protein